MSLQHITGALLAALSLLALHTTASPIAPRDDCEAALYQYGDDSGTYIITLKDGYTSEQLTKDTALNTTFTAHDNGLGEPALYAKLLPSELVKVRADCNVEYVEVEEENCSVDITMTVPPKDEASANPHIDATLKYKDEVKMTWSGDIPPVGLGPAIGGLGPTIKIDLGERAPGDADYLDMPYYVYANYDTTHIDSDAFEEQEGSSGRWPDDFVRKLKATFVCLG